VLENSPPGKKYDQKEYQRAYYLRNREKTLARQRNRRLANPKLFQERSRRSDEKRKDAKRAKGEEWKEINQERWNAYLKEYYIINKERIQNYNKGWDKRNPQSRNAIWQRHRARKIDQLGEWPISETEMIEALWSEQDASCYYCGTSLSLGFDLEHMLPLSRGGLHDWRNVCLSCRTCNLKKHTLTAKEFFAREGVGPYGRGQS